MPIATVAQLERGINSGYEIVTISKGSSANAVAGQHHSDWNVAGLPIQGGIPTASVTVLNDISPGGIQFIAPNSSESVYIAEIKQVNSNAVSTLEIHDRLVHMGALNATLTTAQPVNIDLSILLGTSNLDQRKGDPNYSDVMWWLECYAQLGGTASTMTVNVIYNDGTTGNLAPVAIGTSIRPTRLISLNSFIPLADSGKYIRGINNCTLSISTGSAGNFGFTATRYRAASTNLLANRPQIDGWAALGLPQVHERSCLFPIVLPPTTATGSKFAHIKLIKG